MLILTHEDLAAGLSTKPVGTTGHWQTRHPQLTFNTRGVDAATAQAKFFSAYYKHLAGFHEAEFRRAQL